ncbi:clan AA aspartic protease [uncultured Nostoc sp.]|uniref:clan AA aspartic protease n=1 Tax=uncultured Nostoc sp. TaxID=340711 RepID=UPI0035CA667C
MLLIRGLKVFLPCHLIWLQNLACHIIAKIQANLADNSKTTTNAHAIKIVWNGAEREVIVLAMGRRPLLGTSLLADYHFSIDFYEGGTVLVDEIL